MKMKWMVLTLAVTALETHAVKKQRLHSQETSREGIRAHAESYGSSESHVVVVVVNGAEKDAEVSGNVKAMNTAKSYTVASCPFKTNVPAGAEVKKKIKCQVGAADALEIELAPAVKP